MKSSGSRLNYYFSFHFRQSKQYYVLILLCTLVGAAIGIALHFTSGVGSFFLSDDDQQIFNIITKDSSIISFSLSKIGNFLVSLIILFVCALSAYSCFLCFAFFAYQGLLFAASCCQIISLYSLLGVFNVVLLLLPINIILFAFLSYFLAICLTRTMLAHKYKMSLKTSFLYCQYFWKEVAATTAIGVLFVIAVTIICNIVLRSVSFVIF